MNKLLQISIKKVICDASDNTSTTFNLFHANEDKCIRLPPCIRKR